MAGSMPARSRPHPTIPPSPSCKVLPRCCTRRACRRARSTEVVHGTTVASNTILQKVGARTGLLTTRGFRDVLEIGRIRTPGMFDLTWSKPEPLVPRRWRLEVRGAHRAPTARRRAAGRGVVFARRRAPCSRSGVEAVAICFINSYAQRRARAARRRDTARALPVAAGHRLLRRAAGDQGIRAHLSTTVVNAYLLPAMRGYLSQARRAACAPSASPRRSR